MTKGIHPKISNQFNQDEVLIDVTGFQIDYFGQIFSRPVVSIDALVMLTLFHCKSVEKSIFYVRSIYKLVSMCVDSINNIPSWYYNIMNPIIFPWKVLWDILLEQDDQTVSINNLTLIFTR